MEQQILAEGTVLGDRFSVESLAGQGDLGQVYKARDTKDNKVVALRVIAKEMIADETHLDMMRVRVKEASALTHRNVRATFGMGVQDDGTIFIAVEWVEGQNLRTLLTKRAEVGKRFSFKGAYNIIGHVCNALTYAHAKTFHGGLSPRAIQVNNAGRVKVSDWGLSVVRIGMSSYAGRKKVESSFWAPEVIKSGSSANDRSDIFSLGAIFYELITGVAPRRPLRAPSLLGFSKEVDSVVARCMAADPHQRFENPAAVKNAISSLAKAEETPVKKLASEVAAEVDDDLGIDVEIDLGAMGVQEPGAKFKEPVQAFNPERSGTPPPPKHDGGLLDAPGLPAPPSTELGTDGEAPPPAIPGSDDQSRASTIDMGAVLSSIGKSEAARWMVQKDKFDHGPFTDRELIQMIIRGEVLAKHQLLNMDTGVRKKVKAWKDFDEFLERYRIEKKKREEAEALKRTKSAEKRGTAFKVGIALAAVGVIGLAAGAYFISRQFREEKVFDKEELIAALDSGEIKLRTGGNPIDTKKRRGKGGKRKGGKGGGGNFVPGMSYEEAMNVAMDMGSLTSNSGQKQLTAADIENIMNRHVRKFLPCMAGETTKRVDMNIAVAGSGKVIGVSVKKGSPKLKGCVASKVRRIKFPQSSAPRTATNWYFELY
jgi:serine/threonine-protein kinase